MLINPLKGAKLKTILMNGWKIYASLVVMYNQYLLNIHELKLVNFNSNFLPDKELNSRV